jgi:hypothetical protein
MIDLIWFPFEKGKKQRIAGNCSVESGRKISQSIMNPALTGIAMFFSWMISYFRFDVSHLVENMESLHTRWKEF